MLLEQIPSTDTWGREFYSVPTANRTSGDILKFLAAEDGTVVSVNGAIVATLDRGEVYEFESNVANHITATAPIYAAQFTTSSSYGGQPGDPSFIQLIPAEQYITSYITDPATVDIDDHYVNIAAPADATITLNGVEVDSAEFTPVPGTTFKQAQLSITPGSNVIEGDRPFMATGYGFGSDNSYGYPLGMGLAPVAAVATLDLDPATAALLPGNTHTVTATVSDTAGNPLEGIRVDFTVSGQHDENGFAYTDSAGLVTFDYVGASFGSDTITAQIGTIEATATANWIGTPPTISVDDPDQGEQFIIGETVIVTGLAEPGPSGAQIAAVTGGVSAAESAAALDATGKFFSSITVLAGSNDYTFTVLRQVRSNGDGHVDAGRHHRSGHGYREYRTGRCDNCRSVDVRHDDLQPSHRDAAHLGQLDQRRSRRAGLVRGRRVRSAAAG